MDGLPVLSAAEFQSPQGISEILPPLSEAAEAAKRRAMETDPTFLSLEQILGADDAQLKVWFPNHPQRVMAMMTEVAQMVMVQEVGDVVAS